MSKEMYIEEYDLILDKCEELGVTNETAHKIAETKAYDAMRERYADMIDRARDEAKYKDVK
jgi:hypothetical protein